MAEECTDPRFKQVTGKIVEGIMSRMNEDTRRKPSIGNILTILGMLGVLLTVWWNVAGSAETLKTRVTQIENRQAEDRRSIKEEIKEIRLDTKQTNENMQKVLNAVTRIGTRQEELMRRNSP